MPYLGNTPPENFVNVVKQDITGNGGQNYSLNHPVVSAADLEVFVNNVQQEPTTAYTVSGSTITFDEAVSSTDDIYVIFRARSIGTAHHPADLDLNAKTGTFNRTSTEGSALTLKKDGTTFGTLGVDGSDLVIDGPSGHTGLRMTTSGLLPRQNGAIIDNTIDLGSGGYRYNDLYLGGNLYSGGAAIGGTDPDPTNDGTAARAFLAVQGSGNRGCLALGTSSSAGADVASIRFNNGSDTVGSITVDSASGSTDNGTITVRAGTVNQVSVDSGSVGINQSAGGASGRLHVAEANNRSAGFFLNTNSGFSSTTLGISTSRTTTAGAYNHLACSIHGVATKFIVYDGGQVVNATNSYGQISDQRLKENIVDASSQWDDIKALQVRNFNFIGDDLTQLGVVAQEVEAAGMNGLIQESAWFDAASNPDSEVRKTVKYSVLYMKAVKALQEAMTRIETLEAKVAALEGN